MKKHKTHDFTGQYKIDTKKVMEIKGNLGIKNIELAKKIGCTSAYVSLLLKGGFKYNNTETIHRIAGALNVRWQDIIAEDNND